MRFDGRRRRRRVGSTGCRRSRSARFDRHEVEAVTGRSPMIVRVGAELMARQRIPPEVRVAQPSLEEALLRLLNETVVEGASS